ncbi:hypothetical protein GCM10007874_57960 [Labrys miyagiensis]|uniref:Uncharacterized protein n=1 Tax=Labrys miyagiensis TaxID=346912 RepID=A0ABQ6CX18_9HYPH|nr:hypothetical protein [Labrys miyagiensis]GLS22776.1 hypothetical protein GCM10007874_57960 [Labrys miyagiensis]
MPAQASFRRFLQSVSAPAFLAACALGAAHITPAAGQAQAACAIRDWRCLLKQAATDVQKDKQDSGDNHGRYLVDIVRGYPEADRVGLAQQFLASAGQDDDLQTRLENFLVPAQLRQQPDVEALRKALASGVSPEPDFALTEYARLAFQSLIARNDKDTILKLWREEGKQLWRNAPQAELAIDSWLAETTPDILKESIRTRGLVDGGWAAISGVAERLCRQGAKDRGDGLLALLEQERTTWNTNRSHDATNLASTVMAVAACDGFEAAEKRLDAAESQMKSDVAAIRTHIADKDDAQATIDLLEQTVAETGVRPLIRAYLDVGRTDDAVRVFGRLPAQDAADGVVLGTDGSPGDPDAENGEGGWQTEYRSWAEARSFSADPQLVLADVDRWGKEDDDNVGADAMAQMLRTAEALPNFKGTKRPFVVKLKALGERIAALPNAEGLARQQTEVMLADAELQIAGCRPSDDQFQAWEKAFAAAPDIQTRVEGIVAVARLLRHIENGAANSAHDPGYGACVIARG